MLHRKFFFNLFTWTESMKDIVFIKGLNSLYKSCVVFSWMTQKKN